MKKTILALILASAVMFSVHAQETEEEEIFVPTYSLGDQLLSINLGLFGPLFFFGGPDGAVSANLTLGGAGSLAWASYLSNEWTVGVEVGGSFSFTPNMRALWMVPVAARGSYIFRFYPFEVPVTVAAGLNFSRLVDNQKIDGFVKAGASFIWNYSSQWGFGANLMYWFVPQIYTASSTPGADATRFGNFLEFTLSALYHL